MDSKATKRLSDKVITGKDIDLSISCSLTVRGDVHALENLLQRHRLLVLVQAHQVMFVRL